MLFAVLSTDTQNTLKYHLVTVKSSFAVKTIDCLHQTWPTGRKMERLGMLHPVHVHDSLFPQSLSKFSLVYLLAWYPPLHIPYISSPSHCFLFATHAHTITACLRHSVTNFAWLVILLEYSTRQWSWLGECADGGHAKSGATQRCERCLAEPRGRRMLLRVGDGRRQRTSQNQRLHGASFWLLNIVCQSVTYSQLTDLLTDWTISMLWEASCLLLLIA